MSTLSVVIPAFNETERLPPTLREVALWLDENALDAEILVVDDGSEDDTVAVVRGLIGELPRLRLLECQPNRGKGNAVRRGMLAAKGQLRLFMDADHSTRIGELPRLIKAIEAGADVAIGSRKLAGSTVAVRQPAWRRAWSNFAHVLVASELPGIVDAHCGFKLFTASAAERVFSATTTNSWTFDVEALAIALKMGLRVDEVSVAWADDPRSRVRPWLDAMKVTREYVQIKSTLSKAERTPPARGDRRADARLARELASAAIFEPYRPVLAQMVVTRRCNLACSYCVEYDHTSAPVAREVLEERLDHLARMRAVMVVLTGGEPLLHPELPALIAGVRRRGMTPALNTNGLLLTQERIRALDRAGLYAMQLSIDTVHPNEHTQKSLDALASKLELLSRHARFIVRVNTVLGAGPPEEALEVAKAVLRFGFESKCSLARDPSGKPFPIDAHTRAIYDEIRALEGRSPGYLSEDFQLPFVAGQTATWSCRAGARFFHVCENGLVHYCAPKWGTPGVPLSEWDEAAIRGAFHAHKPCAAHCPVPYAHQVSRMDSLRPQMRS